MSKQFTIEEIERSFVETAERIGRFTGTKVRLDNPLSENIAIEHLKSVVDGLSIAYAGVLGENAYEVSAQDPARFQALQDICDRLAIASQREYIIGMHEQGLALCTDPTCVACRAREKVLREAGLEPRFDDRKGNELGTSPGSLVTELSKLLN